MTPTLTLAAINFSAFGIVQWVILAIVICGVVGIALIAAKHSGIDIPPYVKPIVWIVVLCVVAIVAIKIIASMI